MLYTDSSCRRGTSTILGTLIFVGILFTAVIPMFLVMRQADTLHEMRKHQLEIIDEEKEREYLRVRISPVLDSYSMILKVENKGDSMIKIIRLWVNEKDEEWIYLLDVNEDHEELLLIEETGSYSVIVVTEKGNLFASDNSLNLDGDGVWSQEDVYAIYVRISYDAVIFHITVTDLGDFTEYASVQRRGKGGTAFKAFIVPGPGTYYIEIITGGRIIHESSVTILAGEGEDKSVWVDA